MKCPCLGRMVGGSVETEFTALDGGGERPPVGRSERQRRAVRVLGIPHGDDARQVVGDIDAAAAVAAAVTALMPDGSGYGVAHRCSATFPIRSREAPRGSASALSVSNVSESLPTTDGTSAICPWSGDSMYTVLGELSKLATMKAPSRPACAPISAGTTCTVMFERHELSAKASSW